MGRTIYPSTNIELAKYVELIEVSDESKDSTFCHEIVHAILGEMGHELNDNEKFVQTISTFFNQVIHQLIEVNQK